ncbi:MAG: hypothetical protein ATN35_05710 [Epulopiscium sp. Nele67-Bin004]|nr:MAG: hypothetical protein ATN35_05710 [Epulopiscium sp. Nele67-Bin004]
MIIFLLFLFVFSTNLHAQDDSKGSSDSRIEEPVQEYKSELIRYYELTQMKVAYWLPSLHISERVSGYFVSGDKSPIPVAQTLVDLQLFRYSTGFMMFRFYYQIPLSETSKYGLDNRFIGVGVLAGGNLYDNRKVHMRDNKKYVNGTAVGIAGEGYRIWVPDNMQISISGIGLEFTVVNTIDTFFAIHMGVSLNFGTINNEMDRSMFTSVGGTIGLAF